MRVAIYMRVSTGEQTTANQERDLAEAAERHGWQIVSRFIDEGISGAKGRDKRPAFDRLCNAITRREVDLVAAWSVDRLGRSLQHLVTFLGDLQGAGVGLYLHKQALDTTTPSGRALFGMLSVFGEFERAMIVERTRAGMARARAKGTKSGKPIGRASLAPEIIEQIKTMAKTGMRPYSIGKALGVDQHTAAKYAVDA